MVTVPSPQVLILSNVNSNKISDVSIRIKSKLKCVGLNCRLDPTKEAGSININLDVIRLMDVSQYDLIILALEPRCVLSQTDIGVLSHFYAAQATGVDNKYFIILNNDNHISNNQEILSNDICNIIINNAFKNAFKRG